MPPNTLIIVPPQTGGVLDYARVVAAGLGPGAEVLPFDPALQVQPGQRVLVQYSGYGYDGRGVPWALLGWVRRERARMGRLGLFVHETYATAPPTSSVFWFSALQRHVLVRLARLADFWVANTEVAQRWLSRRAPRVRHLCLAVVSNVGELPIAPARRAAGAVVFGSSVVRERTWATGGPALFQWATQAGLVLHDVGPPSQDPALAARFAQHGVQVHGRLDAQAVHALLAEGSFGVVAYDAHCVSKSGVFAAYCAHGLAPVVLSDIPGGNDGLHAGVQYFDHLPLTGELAAREAVARAAHGWYQGHDIAVHVKTMNELLGAP